MQTAQSVMCLSFAVVRILRTHAHIGHACKMVTYTGLCLCLSRLPRRNITRACGKPSKPGNLQTNETQKLRATRSLDMINVRFGSKILGFFPPCRCRCFHLTTYNSATAIAAYLHTNTQTHTQAHSSIQMVICICWVVYVDVHNKAKYRFVTVCAYS